MRPRSDQDSASSESGQAASCYDRSAEEATPGLEGLEEAGAAYIHAGERASTISVEDALVAEAGKATQDGAYLRAAELFAGAAKLAPHRVDYVSMRGHCLKDGRDFVGAFRAYEDALAAAPSGDAHVQLGHLFKITGNLNEAKLAYGRGAGLGEADAALELQNLGSLSAAQLSALAAAEANALSIELFFEVARCDREDAFDRAAIVAAGKALFAAGASDLVKAFFEIAFIGDDAGTFRQEHYAIVERYPVWPATHLSELVRASAARAAERPLTARARLKKLVAATLAVQSDDGDEEAQDSPASARTPDWPPEVLTADASEPLLERLMGALTGAYRAFSTETPLSGAAVIEAVRALDQATHPSDHLVSFPIARAPSDLRLVAARVLNATVRRWLRVNRSRFFGPLVQPEHVEANLLPGGPRLRDLVEELGSAAAVFEQINAELLHVLGARGSPSPAIDRVFARLLGAIAPAAEDAIEDFAPEAVRRRLPKGSAVPAAAGGGANKIIDSAQRLRAAGHSQFACDFMNLSRDEAQAPREYLIEKALLAKIVGDFANSARLFEALAAADPSDTFCRRELAVILPEVEPVPSILDRLRADPLFLAAARERYVFRAALGEEDVDFDEARVDDETRMFELAPEMAAEFAPPVQRPLREEIEVLTVGRRRRAGFRGVVTVLGACDFVRARVYSRQAIIKMRARLDGKTVAVASPTPLPAMEPRDPIRAWMVNCWLDLSTTTPGRHELQLYFEDQGGGYRSRELLVWVELSPARRDSKPSESIIDLPADTAGLTVEERVRRLPSLVFPAKRGFFEGKIESILVIRADQLGDVTMSLPAMFRLSELFPEARMTCLAAPSNRDLLLSTGLFSEVLGVELTYDPIRRRRYSTLSEQVRLKTLLRPKHFDLAVDLQPGADSRPLLRLAQARYTVGFSPAEFPWLSFGVDVRTRDVDDSKEASAQSTRSVALIDALASVMRHRSLHLPSPNIDAGLLEGLGLDPGRGFAALHSGARTASRKWPFAKYVALAEKIIEQFGLQAALLADSPADAAGVDLPVAVGRDLKVITHRLSFPQLDAVLSRCAVFVGNDAGPKHLAALRGPPVVSIHMGAVPWREWGQDGSGFIVTRRAPCYGCGIEDIADCGKGVPCLVDITVEEVFGAVRRAIEELRRPLDETDAPASGRGSTVNQP